MPKYGEKMSTIHHTFSNRFRSQWIKIKFYTEKPDLKDAKRLKNVRFCEATNEAVLHPIILDRESISCPGAQYAFGWQDKYHILEYCLEKTKLSEKVLQSMLQQMPRFENTFECIGLNTEGEPDLIMSYMMPENVMHLINLYHSKVGKNLGISLCSMMSICGGIAVRTFLENRITFSFGCMDSRKYGQIGRDRLIVGIPRDQFDLISFDAGN
jgi:uncharacterized protein (DUF169 family)